MNNKNDAKMRKITFQSIMNVHHFVCSIHLMIHLQPSSSLPRQPSSTSTTKISRTCTSGCLSVVDSKCFTLERSSSFPGAFISFFALLFTVLAIIVFYEFYGKTRNDLPVAQAERLKDFQVSVHRPERMTRHARTFHVFKGMATLPMEFNDIRSILMNEFILEAWKREKHRRERLS